MRRCKIIISAIALIVMCSCYLGVKNIKIKAPGYVSYYLNMCKCRVTTTSTVEDGNISINLVLYAQQASSVDDYAKHKKKSHYYKLCQKYDDLYYGQDIRYSTMPGMDYNNGVSAFSEIITGISIVSDDDWNIEYPRGTLLNDLFSVKCVTLYPYIQSRYMLDNDRSSIDMQLSDISENNLKMLTPYQLVEFDEFIQTGQGWVKSGSKFLEFYTDKLPDNPIQSLHITLITDEECKKLEYSVELDLR